MAQSTDTHLLQISRIIEAPRDRVFDAWVNPQSRKQWWAAKPGMTCDLAEIDATVGGRYRVNMKEPESDGGREFVCVGEFIEFDRPIKLVFTWGWEHYHVDVPGSGATDTLVTIEFREHAQGMELVLTHERFAKEDQRDDHRGGWTGCLQSLATHVCVDNE